MHRISLLGLALFLALLACPAVAQRTALQKHVDFFDRNDDGKIKVGETAEGLRALGIGSARSWALAVAINGGLGRSTGSPWYDALTVRTDKIHQAKHGSDTDIYDENGHYVQAEFDRLFADHDSNGDGALSSEEFEDFYRDNHEDTVSSIASRAEFGLLLEVAGERRVTGWSFWGPRTTRVLTRRKLEEFYDGSLFYEIAGETVPF